MGDELPSNITINGSYGTHNLMIGANECKIVLKEIELINDDVSDIDSLLKTINIKVPETNQKEIKIADSVSIIHEDTNFKNQYDDIKDSESLSTSESVKNSNTVRNPVNMYRTPPIIPNLYKPQVIPNLSKPQPKLIPKIYASGRYRRTYDRNLI